MSGDDPFGVWGVPVLTERAALCKMLDELLVELGTHHRRPERWSRWEDLALRYLADQWKQGGISLTVSIVDLIENCGYAKRH